MKAVVFHEHGPVENLSLESVPVPEPGAGDVRIKVAYCALNHLDLWTRDGLPGLKLEMPHIGGSDISGTVDTLGAGTERYGFQPGDRVVVNPGVSCGHCRFCRMGEDPLCDTYHILGEHTRGGYAEYAVVPVRSLMSVPEGVPLKTAAAASLAYQTAYRMVVGRAKLRPRENLLVLGAGSGVSTACIQIGKMLGATVYTITSSDEKMRLAKAIGADHVVDYTKDTEWEKTLYKLSGKRGMDVVVDHVGEATWVKSMRTLGKGGRIVTCGGTTGPKLQLDVRHLFWKGHTVMGSTMANDQEWREVMGLVYAGKLEPVIDTEFGFADLPDAHRRMEEAEQFGKIVIRVAGEPDS
ncbi:MAG: zinc-binding dehydrogenase [Euryarchaeota archaeon]|nr:zinc-binding dehydrogenase [Euryarchaeota archaeon]